MQPNNPNGHGPHVVENQDAVADFLGDSATHDLNRPVIRVDTHDAIVFLAGPYVYKIKRAVRYPYLDFSTLEKRRSACQREIEVNRDNAPEIYLGIIAITTDSHGELAIGGSGEVVEWAVKMRRFDEKATLDLIAAHGPLPASLIDALTLALVDSHARAVQRSVGPWIADLAAYVDNDESCFKEWPELFDIGHVHVFSETCRDAYRRLMPLIEQRGRMGYVRLCHGDCHLGNIVLIDSLPVLFDAIEFDDGVATGDVLYDLAFLLMDLWQRGDRAAAGRLLTRYLAATHNVDHLEGLAALPFFMALRAGIRAMVTASRLPHLDAADAPAAARQAQHYFETAQRLIDPPPPCLIAVGGLSGTGKSTLAMALAPSIGRAPGAVVLRSDIERKILHGVGETDRLPEEAYRDAATKEVYHRLMTQARTALAAGQSVIVDAVFAKPEERHAVERVAAAVEVPFQGLWLEAPRHLLETRVRGRAGDASDADDAVIRRQLGYEIGDLNWSRIDASGAHTHSFDLVQGVLKTTVTETP